MKWPSRDLFHLSRNCLYRQSSPASYILSHIRLDGFPAGGEDFPGPCSGAIRSIGLAKTKDILRRIRRFEQISGWPLASTESLAEVWLAMRSTAAVPEG